MNTEIVIVLMPLLALLVGGVVFAIGYFSKGPDAVAKKAAKSASHR
jgi:hypothetical protein